MYFSCTLVRNHNLAKRMDLAHLQKMYIVYSNLSGHQLENATTLLSSCIIKEAAHNDRWHKYMPRIMSHFSHQVG